MLGNQPLNGQIEATVAQPQTNQDRIIDDTLTLTVDSRAKRKIMQQSPQLVRAIERTLVACVHEQPLVDDRTVLRALACAIRREVDTSETIAFVIAKLALSASELQANDEEWRDSLRCIYTNVQNQSDLAPGEYSYLIYTSSILLKDV